MNDTLFYKLTPIMEEALRAGGIVKLRPCGYSMLPFIRPDFDEVLIGRPQLPLRCGEIYLFRRDDSSLVLHRLVRINADALSFRGDNQLHNENNVSQRQLLGQVISIRRGKRKIKSGSALFLLYRLIAFPLCVLRRIYYRLRRIK